MATTSLVLGFWSLVFGICRLPQLWASFNLQKSKEQSPKTKDQRPNKSLPGVSQLLQRPEGVFPRHLLAPVHYKVGIVEWAGADVSGLSGFVDTIVVERATDQRLGCLSYEERSRSDAAENDASVGNTVAPRLSFDISGDAEHGKIKRAATPQFLIRSAPAIRRRKLNINQKFISTFVQVIYAIVVVQTGRINEPFAKRGSETQLRADCNHDRHEVGRLHRPALGAAGSHPTNVAILLQTEVDAFAPFIILVVVVATCVEQEVAADRAHIAQERG